MRAKLFKQIFYCGLFLKILAKTSKLLFSQKCKAWKPGPVQGWEQALTALFHGPHESLTHQIRTPFLPGAKRVLFEEHTSVVDVPEGRIDELPEVPGLLCDVHQHWDGDVLTAVEVQQGFRQTGFTRGWLWPREKHS